VLRRRPGDGHAHRTRLSAVWVLLLLLLVGLAALAVLRLLNASARATRLREARWRAAVHALPAGGYRVVVECEGEPAQLVREIPAGLDAAELSSALAEGRADAEEHAAALNAAR
jgi:uncharacterized protein YdbL (DUF1318 family)